MPALGMGVIITCQCGCGTRFLEYDDRGRRRRFVPGHYQMWLRALALQAGMQLDELRKETK